VASGGARRSGVLTGRDVAWVRRVIAAEAWLTREALARRVCRRLGWRQGNGAWAVSACRAALRRLERAGQLRLPAPRRVGNFFARRRPVVPEPCAAPDAPQGVAGPLEVRPVQTAAERQQWRSDLAREHYLGCPTLVAEALCYTAWLGGAVVAHLGWAAAALHNGPRDRFLGWDVRTKRARLRFVVNNIRFLLRPGVAQPNLASRILAANLRRLAADWAAVHGHAVWLAETFVDRARFRGTCYRAANWRYLGETRGFARRGPTYAHHGRPKAVFVYPLQRRAYARLVAAPEEAGPRAARRGGEEEGTMLEVEALPLVGTGGLLEILQRCTDPRHRRGRRHTLGSVLAVAVVATLCGARSLAAIAQFAQELPEARRRQLGVRPLRPPSEPTFRRVLQAIDVRALDQQLGQWMARHGLAAGEAVAVDGKTVRGSAEGARPAVHLLAALTHEQGVVIAQERVAETTNEIPMVVPLLERVELRGAVVTADALHTQTALATYLVEEKGADYLFTVKDNQPTLRQDIQHLGHGAFPPGAAARHPR